MSPAFLKLYVKPYVKNIPVTNHVILPFYHQLSFFLAGMLRFQGNKIIVFDNFGPDESPFEIAVDGSCRLRSRHSLMNGPCPDFIGPNCKKRKQIEHGICGTYDAV